MDTVSARQKSDIPGLPGNSHQRGGLPLPPYHNGVFVFCGNPSMNYSSPSTLILQHGAHDAYV